MSGIVKAAKKVFKSAVGLVRKYWKPLVVAACIFFTGGAALGALGAMSAGGSALAGAGAGLSAAAGSLGIGAGAGITGAFAAGAGTAAAAGLGAAAAGGAGLLAAEGAGALGAGAAGAAEVSPWLAGSVLADAGAGAGLAGGAAAAPAMMGGVGMLSSLGGDAATTAATAGTAGTAIAGAGAPSTASAGVPGATSSLWDQSLSAAGKVMSTPGMPTLLGGILQGYEQGKMMDAQEKWAQEHAPGQIAGGAAGAWKPGTFAMNSNLQPNTPMPTAGKLPALQPYNLPSPQSAGQPMPGYGQPGSNSSRYPGYGTPGYGMQPPANPYGQVMPQEQDNGGLLSQTPFIDSPYDQSYA